MRNISCFYTQQAVRDRIKTVTRRLGWKNLKAGALLRVVVKGMGLKRGEKIQPLAIVRVVSVRHETLSRITQADVRREGFDRTPESFVEMFCHHMNCTPQTVVTRVEWKYESRCLSCGFEISKDSDFCGECTCEEDCL